MIRQVDNKEWECTIDDAVTLLNLLLAKGDAVMLWGDTGIGKSSIVYQVGNDNNEKVIDFRTNIREPVDMRGIPVPDLQSGVTRWLPPAELPRVERDGETGIFFMDEINTNAAMMPVCMQLVLERRVGEYEFPKKWKIVAAGNRVSDRAAAQKMPSALRNRFAHITIIPDVDAWCSWAILNAVAPEMVAFIRLRREFIHKRIGDENAFPSPRSLEKAAQYVDAPKRLRTYLFASHIGYAAASEFDAFLDVYRAVGTLDDIAKNPDTAELPTDASLRWAVCTALGQIATRQNFANIIRYAKRVGGDYEILIVNDATLRDETLKKTPAYGKWAVENQNLIVQAA